MQESSLRYGSEEAEGLGDCQVDVFGENQRSLADPNEDPSDFSQPAIQRRTASLRWAVVS